MCCQRAVIVFITHAHSSQPPSQAAGTRQVTDDLESGEPAQAPATAASPPVPAAPSHSASSLACPVRALLVVLASVACACIGIWLMLDDKHVPLTPSCAPDTKLHSAVHQMLVLSRLTRLSRGGSMCALKAEGMQVQMTIWLKAWYSTTNVAKPSPLRFACTKATRVYIGRPGALSLAVIANNLPLALSILWCLANAAVFSIPLCYACCAPAAPPAAPPAPADGQPAPGSAASPAACNGAGAYAMAVLAFVALAAYVAAAACIGLGRGASSMPARFVAED